MLPSFFSRLLSNLVRMKRRTSSPYLKCPQRRLYSAWKIADIYLRRSAEYWDALSASLRKLEILSVRTSAIFPYAGPQLSAERSAEVCGHLWTSLRMSMRTSAWIGADVLMDWCGCLRNISICRSAVVRRGVRGSLRTSVDIFADVYADVRMDWCGRLHGLVRTSAWICS